MAAISYGHVKRGRGGFHVVTYRGRRDVIEGTYDTPQLANAALREYVTNVIEKLDPAERRKRGHRGLW
jgi:hypothetical protein